MTKGKSHRPKALYQISKVLWHLDIFRRSFRDLSGHACMADSCIFCALKELFSQLQFSNETALPPDALRRALAESFFDQQRFQLGFMDDAAECFENMLLRIHMHIAHGEAEDMCNARHCIPHQKFAMTLVEQSVCGSCGATSEPLSYTQMVHYVSTSTLVYQVRNRTQNMLEPFGQLLRKAGSMGDVRVCPSACGAVIQIGRTLMNRPEIVSIGLVWNSERPTLEHIMEVFSTIGTTLHLNDVFNTVVDKRWAETCIHNLVGVVTYYGKHYSTFFFHTKLRVWIYFDDATVREVGPRWEQVVEKCRKGRYQPLLLLYALPDGTPVNTENAPKQVTPFYNDKSLTKKPPVAQSVLRRSVTPSPEKPIIGNTRRAITPNPDLGQKMPLTKPYNEYQNLSVIQSNLYNNNNGGQPRGVDVVDAAKDPEYVSGRIQKPPSNIHRTLSNGSSSGTEACFRDYLNVPRTRDSGNWSSDRNSASSSSSTTMENPYSYLVGKVHHEPNAPNNLPPRNESSSSNSSGVYDVGYDSYSLSSNDSSTMTTIQHLMKMGHLAKIPEDYNSPPVQQSKSCDVLCDEADDLLVKSRQLEDDHDLVLALALCNAAATKARAAMDAPYNNPQTLTLARMKHNTCIMRARSLHRRMTQTQIPLGNGKDMAPLEVRHTREGSSSGRHSRQGSRDKGQHSRQNSRELVAQPEKQAIPIPTKSIEIYATLPKKKDGLKKVAINIDDSLYDKPPNRESRSIFSRSKNKENYKIREKRSRSEDRNKLSRDFSIAPEITISPKEVAKKEKVKEEKEDKKDKEGKTKKQHKIRRKLLMGGLIRRKNRSMPDLTEANADKDHSGNSEKPTTTLDDSSVGLKKPNGEAICGYLSEGHLEFAGNCPNTNPNLERSKLMRKSFHGSAGKILTAAKVPPPPPLRTTSQLSTTKLSTVPNHNGEVEEKMERPKYPLPNELPLQNYQNPTIMSYDVIPNYSYNSLPFPQQQQQQPYQPFPNSYDPYSNTNKFIGNESNKVVTKADVHQEQDYYSNSTNANNVPDEGVDEVDCAPAHGSLQNLDLPPYPSPMGSAIHSRQPSEEFPPPPPPLDLSALDEHLDLPETPVATPGSLLAQLQHKRQEILSQETEVNRPDHNGTTRSSGDTWLKELQAKQAALRIKKSQSTKNGQDNESGFNDLTRFSGMGQDSSKVTSSVRDLATKFENIQVQPVESPRTPTLEREPDSELGKIEVQPQLQKSCQELLSGDELLKRNKLGKKKSVSFCDQVILVATAEDQEDDSYIPNPILERVLRSAMNKPESVAVREELQALRQAEAAELAKVVPEEKYIQQQPLYVRRNSIDNLLSTKQVPVNPAPSTGSECNYGMQELDPNRAIYGTSPQTPQNLQNLRQSPYQRIPQNSPVYMYNNKINPVLTPPEMQYHKAQTAYTSECGNGPTPTPPQTRIYGPQMRQSPNPYPNHQIYQHPPSPSPSTASSNYNYQYHQRQIPPPNSYDPRYIQVQQQLNPNYHHQNQPLQSSLSVPLPGSVMVPSLQQQQQQGPTNPSTNYSPYQTIPALYHPQIQPELITNNNNNNLNVQRVNDPYQRVPPLPHLIDQELLNGYQQIQKYSTSPYQHVLPPKQLLKKTVSFEPGTKGGTESPAPKAIVTPIIVNNANNSVPTGKTKCNLCRKKAVVSSNLYCTDCEFYMSRFKPKR